MVPGLVVETPPMKLLQMQTLWHHHGPTVKLEIRVGPASIV